SQAPALYAISLIVVFLCLAALYESWAIPTSVMLVVPLGVIVVLAATLLRGLSNDVYFQVGLLTTLGLSAKNAILVVEFAKALYESWRIRIAYMLVVALGVIGVLAATLLRGLSNDVYFQVGLLTTVGLSAKNASLIVEFAKAHYEEGASLVEACVYAARQRLRPILMTSMAFILGVVPLAISNGAGSGSQHAIGTGVIGGMLAGTFLAIFFVPAFFVVMLQLFKVKRHSERHEDDDEDPQDGDPPFPPAPAAQPRAAPLTTRHTPNLHSHPR